MIGTYKNKFCDSIYRLFYQDVRVLDKEGKPTKKTNQVMFCQRMSSVVNPEPGEPFIAVIKYWEDYLRLGTMIKINDE